jgi:CheY-like chemotaxis protein
MNIVIIEDNQDHAKILKWAFEQNGRSDHLTFFPDPKVALDFVEGAVREAAFCPDLIILDLNLPKIDGRTVLQKLKSSDSTRTIPIIVLSSSEREDDVRKAYQLGANTYISKALLLDQISSRLKMILEYWAHIAQLPSRK